MSYTACKRTMALPACDSPAYLILSSFTWWVDCLLVLEWMDVEWVKKRASCLSLSLSALTLPPTPTPSPLAPPPGPSPAKSWPCCCLLPAACPPFDPREVPSLFFFHHRTSKRFHTHLFLLLDCQRCSEPSLDPLFRAYRRLPSLLPPLSRLVRHSSWPFEQEHPRPRPPSAPVVLRVCVCEITKIWGGGREGRQHSSGTPSLHSVGAGEGQTHRNADTLSCIAQIKPHHLPPPAASCARNLSTLRAARIEPAIRISGVRKAAVPGTLSRSSEGDSSETG